MNYQCTIYMLKTYVGDLRLCFNKYSALGHLDMSGVCATSARSETLRICIGLAPDPTKHLSLNTPTLQNNQLYILYTELHLLSPPVA